MSSAFNYQMLQLLLSFFKYVLVVRNFLKLLEEFGHDVIGVAECFVNQTEGFAIYSDYCTNYPR